MIPLSIPNLSGNEWKYVKECLDTNWVSSVGSFVSRFESDLARIAGVEKVAAVVNGSAALHLSLKLLGAEQGTMVLVPNITFVASTNAICHTGAEPVFIDVDELTWQMDVPLLRSWLNGQCEIVNGKCIHRKSGKIVIGIMPVHILGGMVDMDELLHLAKDFRLFVLEDAAEALGSKYKGSDAGTIGNIGCLSFNGNKILTTGGGGAILSKDPILIDKAKHLSTQANVNGLEYIHDGIGFNYRLVNILAALGVAQLEQLGTFLSKKEEIAVYYTKALTKSREIQFQRLHEGCSSNNWLFTIKHERKDELIVALNNEDIQCRPLWTPMNQLDIFNHHIYVTEGDKSKMIHSHALSIPCSTSISNRELDKVIDTIMSV